MSTDTARVPGDLRGQPRRVPTTKISWRHTFRALRHRNYRLYFAGQVVSLSGTWMQNTALAWLIVELTHSPVAVGFLAFCRFAPFMFFGLFAGVLADRFDNRKLVMSTQVASMLVSVALAVLVFGIWFFFFAGSSLPGGGP